MSAPVRQVLDRAENVGEVALGHPLCNLSFEQLEGPGRFLSGDLLQDRFAPFRDCHAGVFWIGAVNLSGCLGQKSFELICKAFWCWGDSEFPAVLPGTRAIRS